MKYIALYIVIAILMWFICDWLLLLEFAMKPYTHLGRTIFTYGQHGLFFFISFLITASIYAAIEKGKRK